jgi:hypothetical protein
LPGVQKSPAHLPCQLVQELRSKVGPAKAALLQAIIAIASLLMSFMSSLLLCFICFATLSK